MSDEIKQYWFKLRMENFNQINCTNIIKVEETYAENEKVYAMEVGSTTENEKAYGTEENSTTETDMNDCVEKSTTKEE